MNKPIVSVKMITYNHAPFIARAIEGVLQQKTDYGYELVIGEDCSTDGTREIVFDYQKRYPDIIRVITSEKNVGMKKNGYRTTKACKGKYIAYCEGDDYWQNPNKMQIQADYLEMHPECGLVFTDYNFLFDNSGRIEENLNYSRGFKSQRDLSIEDIIGENGLVIRTCTIMIRRDILELIIEGDPYLHQKDIFLMGDTQIFSEMAVISKVSYLPVSTATYRIIDESASRSNDQIKSCRFWKSASEMKIYLCDKYNLSENTRRKAESAFYNSSLRLAFHSHDEKLAEEILRKKKSFTWDEWVRYYGAKYKVVNIAYSRIASFLNILRGN
jgi:glycosyltransferase involved in cell wall biosynthesis